MVRQRRDSVRPQLEQLIFNFNLIMTMTSPEKRFLKTIAKAFVEYEKEEFGGDFFLSGIKSTPESRRDFRFMYMNTMIKSHGNDETIKQYFAELESEQELS